MNKKNKSYLFTESSYSAKLVATKAPVVYSLRYDLFLILCSLLVPLGLFILFSSCKNNPVQYKNTPPDTVNVYDWTIDTIPGYNTNGLYVADSDNIFISAYPVPIYYNGKIYQPMNLQDPNFVPSTINGYDKNNVFFGGGISGTYYGDPVLKKWTNGNISSFTLIGDSGIYIAEIFPRGPNDCWVSTEGRYNIYHFESGVFQKYSLDSGFGGGTFNVDDFGNLYAIQGKEWIFNNDYIDVIGIYKFQNNNFNLIRTDTMNKNTEMKGRAYFRCGNDILLPGKSSVFYFNGTYWEKLCNTTNFYPFTVAGTSKNNLICYGVGEVASYTGQVYTWNGTSWKMENIKNMGHWYPYDAYSSASQTTANIWILTDANAYNENYHLKGKLKQK